MHEPSYPITVFYDGTCRMCIRQMEQFKARDAGKRLQFVDTARSEFDAERVGLAGAPLQKYLYAQTASGELVRGVDAFHLLWRATNRPLLAFFSGLPAVKDVGKLIYNLISHLRYRLSGKNEGVCDFHCAKEV